MPTVNDIYQQVLGRPADPEGLAYWKSVFGNDVDENELAQFKTAAAPELAQRPAVGSVAELYQQVLGRAPESQAVVDEWTRQFGSTIDANEVAQFRDAAQLEITNPNISNIKGQILAQGTTANWTGQGQGSAEANATDMATILAGIGITDISQFGVLPNGSFGNKVTGQAVPNTYAERQVGNSFGGTFAGSGNTGYRVNFDASGNPIFYTTAASSSDVPNWVKTALVAGGIYLGLDASGLLAGTGAAAGGATTGAAAGTGTGLTVGGAAAGTGITAGAGGLGLSTTGAGLGAGGVGAGLTTAGGLTGTGVLTGSGLGTSLLGTTGTTALTGTGVLAGSTLGTQLLGTGAGTAATVGGVTGLTNAANLGAGALTTGVGAGLGTAAAGTAVGASTGATLAGLTPAQLGALISTGLNTGAGLLQQQTSREAALAAQAMIERETAAAKLAAQFRPIGMTTRFGTSNFAFDPVTGRLIDANYNLSPEAKAQQDRLAALANAGLTQAEGAQAQFAPLQTGAQSLFKLGQGYLDATTDPAFATIAQQYLPLSQQSKDLTTLGSKYIAKTPEDVAKDYLASQLALLTPGREIELANLQNRLQQQGRGGLSVAQGGSYGATTPELQALYNARAMQEAQLAANAQQAGQQQVQFGAGLIGTGQKLGIEGQQFGMNTLAAQQAIEQQRLAFGSGLFNQGAGLMGQYYGGQQAAYAPYTTAMGQVQALETAAQQPFNTSLALAQQQAKSGYDVGQLGLAGAKLSTALSTGAAATTNPYSTALGGLAASPAFGQYIGGLFGSTPATTAMSALPTSFGTGSYYGNQDLGLFL